MSYVFYASLNHIANKCIWVRNGQEHELFVFLHFMLLSISNNYDLTLIKR